ncbi:hypothetical protein EGW08_001492 [Elysia chlorotica]|uniref:G-protein coupled receptors family 1 profile domain-containing protein n=1 Tax=Elysia chlorotica TaxID=188477 RepID=A0A433UAE5_ELYCH|nr:hypothetical protein EGW08_001492 [Elysia chlorotica]
MHLDKLKRIIATFKNCHKNEKRKGSIAVMSPSSSDTHLGPTYRKCPAESFPCVSGQVTCVNRSLLCDHRSDCEDGSDEGALCDTSHILIFDNLFKKRFGADRENESAECSLGPIPEDCDCREETKIYCENRGIQRVPSPLPSEVTFLDISGYNLSSLPYRALGRLPYLQTLKIDSSDVTQIEQGAFEDCPSLLDVILSNNGFSSFNADIFLGGNSIHTLNLLGNSLEVLHRGSLHGMASLTDLVLKSNKITDIEPGVFKDTPNLASLFIRKNRIATIQPHSFSPLTSLTALSLATNSLRSLQNTYFTGLGNLTVLDLYDNDLTTISNGTFDYMPDLRFIYLDKFYLCAYAQQASVCKPEGDGISSKQHLLGSLLLRIAVWLVAMLSCCGNLLVLLGRCLLLREDNPIHSFFIKNLSLADLLMGLYLLVIGVQDARFRGEYLAHDQAWRNSWGCDAAGVLSTLSTEMSVLTLCIITLDRYISIMYPLSFRRRGLKLARLIMAFTWAVCLALALVALPSVGLRYFGQSFYRDNAVCIPLHLHNPRARGWEYSSFLFLGLNLGSFAFIAYAYVAMFYSIHMSALPLRTSRDSKERCLAKRFFFIVITDFLCWIPIIIIKLVALAGVSISNDLYAWVIVFVLPVNSALNPLLFTLTTKLFKKQLLTKFTSVVFKSPSSVLFPSALQAGGSRASRLHADLLLQPADQHNGRPPGHKHRDLPLQFSSLLLYRPAVRERAVSTQTSSSSLLTNTMAARQVTNIEMDILKKYDPAGLCMAQSRASCPPLSGREGRPDTSDALCGAEQGASRPAHQRRLQVLRATLSAQDQASQKLLNSVE